MRLRGWNAVLWPVAEMSLEDLRRLVIDSHVEVNVYILYVALCVHQTSIQKLVSSTF